jgi:hypothetical protein
MEMEYLARSRGINPLYALVALTSNELDEVYVVESRYYAYAFCYHLTLILLPSIHQLICIVKYPYRPALDPLKQLHHRGLASSYLVLYPACSS